MYDYLADDSELLEIVTSQGSESEDEDNKSEKEDKIQQMNLQIRHYVQNTSPNKGKEYLTFADLHNLEVITPPPEAIST